MGTGWPPFKVVESRGLSSQTQNGEGGTKYPPFRMEKVVPIGNESDAESGMNCGRTEEKKGQLNSTDDNQLPSSVRWQSRPASLIRHAITELMRPGGEKGPPSFSDE